MKKSYIVLSPLIALSFLMCSSTLVNPTGGGTLNTLEKTSSPATNDEEEFWRNDGRGDPFWQNIYRFGGEGHTTADATDIVSSEIWERMKTETFYLDFCLAEGGFVELRVIDGWWTIHYTGAPIPLESSLIENLGEGNYRLTITFAEDPILDVIDGHNFSITGGGFIPQRLFFEAGHTCDLMLVNGKNPTLLTPGYKSYYKCKICGECYEDAEGLIPIEDIEAWKINKGRINPILPMSWFIGIVSSLFVVLVCVVLLIIYERNGFAKLDISNITYAKKRCDSSLLDEYVVSFDWRGYQLHYHIFKEKRLNTKIEDIKKEFKQDRESGKFNRYMRKLIAPIKPK